MPYTINCANCGTVFTNKNPQKFCSQSCYWQSLKGHRPDHPGNPRFENVVLVCETCGKQFSLPPSKAKRSKHNFCSSECCGKSNRKDPISPPTAEEFRRWYVDEHMTLSAIAERIGSSMWVTERMLIEFGIPRQSRSSRSFASWVRSDDSRRQKTGEVARKNFSRLSPQTRQRSAVAGARAMQLKRGPTGIESRMMIALDMAGIAYLTQFSVGDKFLCDFAFPEAKLIVECDGEYWHGTAKAKARDFSKDAYLRACGFTVLRFSGTSIKTNINDCVSIIQNYLNAS